MHFRPGVSLILGGARSGKSSFAEQLAAESGRDKIYLATSQAWDGEMEQRIADHQSRRQGSDWQLVEEPVDLLEQIGPRAKAPNCVLVDCLTLWLTNLMMAEMDVAKASELLVQGLADLPEDCSVLLVSNEVGQGIVPIEKMAREFRDHAGRLHQDIAAIAQNVWMITAGLPQKLK
ncbi:MAG: bifunctional adenosylcobinamide kinase/adenosylcobinamide-phosphate guanylyltransferase [Rhizobiaceae bacterium]|nr:bifunctional adenosylcobinamide kinase/adenosylcobinamide-phosphate guanylyltransferase [Rhizobiaceae bacterium]